MSIQHFQTKLGITKYSIVTNSNDSVTLRLMTEHDLAMLYEWLNRSPYRRVVGRRRRRLTLTYRNSTCQAFSARVRHSIHCNAEWRADWVCPVVRCSWKRGRMVEEETDPGVRGIDPVTGECITTGQRREPSWFELWLSCCSMIPRSPRSKRTRRRQACERSDAEEKAGFRGKVP